MGFDLSEWTRYLCAFSSDKLWQNGKFIWEIIYLRALKELQILVPDSL
jgi:hypothetical protein